MKWIPLMIACVMALWPLSAVMQGVKHKGTDLPVAEFGSLPVVMRGREQPMDSLARNSLMLLRKKQTLNCEPWKGDLDKPKMISAAEWLLEVGLDPVVAADRPAFRIDNDDLKGLLNLPAKPDKAAKVDGKHYTWNQIFPQLEALRREAQRASNIKADLRSAYERSLMAIWESITTYQKLGALFGPAAGGDFTKDLAAYKQNIAEGQAAFQARMDSEPHDTKKLDWVQNAFTAPLLVPPHFPERGKDNIWLNALQEIKLAKADADVHPVMAAYSKMAAGYKAKDKAAMLAGITEVRTAIANTPGTQRILVKGHREQLFNYVEPFYKAMFFSVLAILLAIVTWFSPQALDGCRKTGVGLMVVAQLIMLVGLITRMWLEGRPPVTNLYSSAIFISFTASILALLLEVFWPVTLGLIVSGTISFLSLMVAHFLSLEGDTMVMLQAVLDTNIWLATHVVVVTFGYAATFVAGFIALVYVTMGLVQKLTGRVIYQRLGRIAAGMVFAITCFAVLFSFVGTVLGGIWADQSWGRFWGWDPKENGALMIVLWNALILHARMGGIVKERGLMMLAIFGNIITSWSWFGVNQLGIGLHSYGFTSGIATALVSFVGLNLLLIGLGFLLPVKMNEASLDEKPPEKEPILPATATEMEY